jgi:hypothetical protein
MKASIKIPQTSSNMDFALFAPSGPTVFAMAEPDLGIIGQGFCGAEQEGRWTDGEVAELSIPLGWIHTSAPVFLLSMDIRAFLVGAALQQQLVRIFVNDLPQAEWCLRHASFRRHVIGISRASLEDSTTLTIRFELPDRAQASAYGFSEDKRWLGIMLQRLIIEGVDKMPPPGSLVWHYGRHVGGETAKSYDARIEDGFWSRFVGGPDIVDIRYRGFADDVLPIFDGAARVELDEPGQAGRPLPFADSSQDVVFANYCLPHIAGHIAAIQDWHRVIRPGGRIIIAVPSAALYERKIRPPSRRGEMPHRFYSPASLLGEIEAALAPNTYRIRFLAEDDTGYAYGGGLDSQPTGRYELTAVVEKITPPGWTLES